MNKGYCIRCKQERALFDSSASLQPEHLNGTFFADSFFILCYQESIFCRATGYILSTFEFSIYIIARSTVITSLLITLCCS